METIPSVVPGKKEDLSNSSFSEAKLYVWVKGLEMKVNNLLREIDFLKNDFLKKVNSLRSETKTIGADVLEVQHEREKLLQKMDLIIKELQNTAGKDEVMVLRKYVDLWNPFHFVTQKDVERIIEEKMRTKKAREKISNASVKARYRKKINIKKKKKKGKVVNHGRSSFG